MSEVFNDVSVKECRCAVRQVVPEGSGSGSHTTIQSFRPPTTQCHIMGDLNHHQHCCESKNVATAVFNAATSCETINTDNILKEPAASFMTF
jgi:hypothetical protein